APEPRGAVGLRVLSRLRGRSRAHAGDGSDRAHEDLLRVGPGARHVPRRDAGPRARLAADHGAGSPRRPVVARTIATTSAATSTKKTIDSRVAISTTGVPAGCAKIPRNGAMSGSVRP